MLAMILTFPQYLSSFAPLRAALKADPPMDV